MANVLLLLDMATMFMVRMMMVVVSEEGWWLDKLLLLGRHYCNATFEGYIRRFVVQIVRTASDGHHWPRLTLI
jgi:hypothetical protein